MTDEKSSPIRLVAVDSVSIELPSVSRRYARPYFRADGKFLYYLMAADSLNLLNRPEQVRIYKLDGGDYVASMRLKLTARIYPTELVAVVGTKNETYVGYGSRSFLRLKWQLGAQVPDTLTFAGNYQGRDYWINLYRPTHYPCILPDGRWLISVIDKSAHYHFTPQLLALCRPEGEKLVIERLLGQRDDIYQRYHLAHLEATNFTMNENNRTLYISQEASPIIREYTWDGQAVSAFGQAAQQPGLRVLPSRPGFSLNRFKNDFAFSRSRVESVTYQGICYDALTDTVIRTYKEAEKTQMSWPAFKEQEKTKEPVCGAATPPTAQAQVNTDQDRARPTHVQVYQNQQLVLDAPVPRGFQLLKAEGGQIWGVGLPDFEHKTVKLYVYRYQSLPANDAPVGKSSN